MMRCDVGDELVGRWGMGDSYDEDLGGKELMGSVGTLYGTVTEMRRCSQMADGGCGQAGLEDL